MNQVGSNSRLLGAHMPAAGGIDKSLTRGKEIGCTAVQLFTRSPRQWKAPPLDPEVVARFREAQKETGIGFTVAHDSYLINLAASDPVILERSREAFRDELNRAEALGIPWVVTHMGAHAEVETGIRLLCENISRILEEFSGQSVGIALETTAGQGTSLGHRFEHIADVVEGCGNHPRVGVCLDTCHIHAAGYDIRDEESYERTLGEFDSLVGLDRLKVIHANDSKKPLGSRVDRHQHIGEGDIGIDAFARLVTDSRLLHIPVIVETPESEKMHAVNLAKLIGLANGKRPGIRVKALFFGHYRDFCPNGMEVEVPPDSAVAEVAEAVVERDSRFRGIERLCRAAVNEEYVPADYRLKAGDTVVFIPPMSGG